MIGSPREVSKKQLEETESENVVHWIFGDLVTQDSPDLFLFLEGIFRNTRMEIPHLEMMMENATQKKAWKYPKTKLFVVLFEDKGGGGGGG